jgi:hypothetical protein
MNPVVTDDHRSCAYTAGMSLVVRALLVWLLALAIPVQGAVAVAMRCCGPDHHQGQSVSAEEGHAHDHAMPGGHAMDTSHDHGAPADAAEQDNSGDADPHAATLKAGKCSACSSCCTATGLPSRAAALQTVPFDEVLVAFVGTPALEFITNGPERPPRPLLA